MRLAHGARHLARGEGAHLERRSFLAGRMKDVVPPLRPPGAIDEAQLVARCTRCDACARACPTGIVVRGAGGYPEVRFDRGACTFCGACAVACEPGVLGAALPAWTAKASLGSRCLVHERVLCRACGESCVAGAIRFVAVRPPAVPQLDAELCTGCGACVRACPVSAVAVRVPAAPGITAKERVA